jgi:hypothetical protein
MQRRDFLRLLSAASVAPAAIAGPQRPRAIVLYDDRATVLDDFRTATPSGQGAASLWIRKADLPRINEFALKPQGACRADVCIPIDKTMVRGGYFDLTAFARRTGQAIVAEPPARVWSFGEMPVVRGSFLESRLAPDVGVPDRSGRIVHLSQFRGKKVLLVTWASW